MKLKTLLKLMFCKELQYLSHAWATSSGGDGHPLGTALLTKLWGVLYPILAIVGTFSTPILVFHIFPFPKEGFRPMNQMFFFAMAALVAFISFISFSEFRMKQREEWSIYQKTYRFTDALVTLIRAIMCDDEATEDDIRHLARRTNLAHRLFFPQTVMLVLRKSIFEIAERVKEYDLLSPAEKAENSYLSFTCTHNKEALRKLLEACQSFGLFTDLSLEEIYATAKKNLKAQTSDNSSEVTP